MSTIFTVFGLLNLPSNITLYLDSLIDGMKLHRLSIDENESLAGLGAQSEEVSLRDDPRFRRTPDGRWIPATSSLANDLLYDQLSTSPLSVPDIIERLEEIEERIGVHTVFCPADPRFVLTGRYLRLAAHELSDEPHIEPTLEVDWQYVTHLPLLRLEDVAGWKTPVDEGDDVLEIEDVLAGYSTEHLNEQVSGWIRVHLNRPLNERMFIARIEDDSMLGESDGVGSCDYALFTYQTRESETGEPVLVRGINGQTGEGFHCLRQIRRDGGLIHLEPRNPDRRLYPLLVLNEMDGDYLEIVAELTEVLNRSSYVRAPKGSALIDDCRAKRQRVSQMAVKVAHFFDGGGVPTVESGEEMRARAVCLKPAVGCLQIEIGPLPKFPKFIRQLRITGDGWVRDCDVEAIRHRTVRVVVPPWTRRLSWQAVGFEDDELIDLSKLEVEALVKDRATVFKLDLEEKGLLVRDPRLRQSESYRLLISSELLSDLSGPLPVTKIEAGWSIWELGEIAAYDRKELVERLIELGVELREEEMQLGFVLIPPVEWCRMGEDNPIPRYLTTTGLVLSLMGMAGGEEEWVLLLVSDQGYQMQPLPADGTQLLRLQDLKPGCYGVEIYDRGETRGAMRLFFEVVEQPPGYPKAGCRMAIGEEWYEFKAGEVRIAAPADLRVLDRSASTGESWMSPTVQIEAPSGWPLTVYWRSTKLETLYRSNADEQGGFDMAALLEATRHRRNQQIPGDLIFDLRELGRLIIPHRCQLDLSAIQEELKQLVHVHATTVQRGQGEYLTLIPLWFEPILKLLGYTIADGPQADHVAGFRVLRLIHEESTPGGYVRQVTRLLFLVRELSAEIDPQLRREMDQILSAEHLRDSLLSDGMRWASRRCRSTLPVRVRDLESTIEEPDGFLDLLREMGEGI